VHAAYCATSDRIFEHVSTAIRSKVFGRVDEPGGPNSGNLGTRVLARFTLRDWAFNTRVLVPLNGRCATANAENDPRRIDEPAITPNANPLQGHLAHSLSREPVVPPMVDAARIKIMYHLGVTLSRTRAWLELVPALGKD